MPRVARPFVAARLLTVTATTENDGYAFSQSGSTLTAYDYSGSARTATRGTLDVTSYPLWGSQYGYTGSGTTSRSIILTDSSGTVGNGSLLFVADDTKLVCWDVSDATAHERTAAAGYHIGGAVFADGYAYWTETENTKHSNQYYIRLMRGRADFSGVSTLATHETSTPVTDGISADAYDLRRTSTGCWTCVRTYNGETDSYWDVWLADSGATNDQGIGEQATDGEPRADGAAVFGYLPHSQAAATGTETALYPMASDGGSDARNVTASGAVYQCYDVNSSNSYRWSTTGNGSATTADSIVTLENAEDVYFYYGS